MWISKKKHQNEIIRLKNENLFKSLDDQAELEQDRIIRKLQKDVKKLKKIIKEIY